MDASLQLPFGKTKQQILAMKLILPEISQAVRVIKGR